MIEWCRYVSNRRITLLLLFFLADVLMDERIDVRIKGDLSDVREMRRILWLLSSSDIYYYRGMTGCTCDWWEYRERSSFTHSLVVSFSRKNPTPTTCILEVQWNSYDPSILFVCSRSFLFEIFSSEFSDRMSKNKKSFHSSGTHIHLWDTFWIIIFLSST